MRISRVDIGVALGIMLAGCGAASISHLLREDRLKLFEKPPSQTSSEIYPRATLEEAKSMWDTGAVIFIDARHSEDYEKGHIPGAYSLHPEDDRALSNFFIEIPPETDLLIYCAGGACKDSVHLAEKLVPLGYENLTVFSGGWPAWNKAQLPVEMAP